MKRGSVPILSGSLLALWIPIVVHSQVSVSWWTYYGGISTDQANATAVDAANNTIVAGFTGSATNIATPGSHQASYISGNGFDGFLAKFDPSGQRLWGTYLGGAEADQIFDVKVDNQGNIIVTGFTSSDDGIATPGVHQTTRAGGEDVFVAKFDPNGNLLWGTYYGGTSGERSYACEVLANDEVIVVGYTNSSTGIATQGAYDDSLYNKDCFLARFSPTGQLLYGTYFGGLGWVETARALAVDTFGNIFVGGSTNSWTGFASVGAHQTTYGSGTSYGDAFLAKFDSDGFLEWATYYGGSADDQVNAMDVLPNGDVVIAGSTGSSTGISTPGTFQVGWTPAGYDDAFVALFSSTGVRAWGTYLGGNDQDVVLGITCSVDGSINVVGVTASDDFPADSGLFNSGTITGNGFLSQFNGQGNLVWSYSLGGMLRDCAMTTTEELVVCGIASGSEDLSSTASHQDTLGGFLDGLLATFTVEGDISVLESHTDPGVVATTVGSSIHVSHPGPEPLMIEAYSSDGRLVDTFTYPSRSSTRDLSRGVYVLRASDGSRPVATLKVPVAL